jgi:putative CocE/NonD family hydrolase
MRTTTTAALAALLVIAAGTADAGTWTRLGTRALPAKANAVVPATGGWVSYNTPALYPSSTVQVNQFIPMDDGVQLAANVGRPLTASGAIVTQPLPTIVTLTTYDKDVGNYQPILGGTNKNFVQHGYVHVTVDVRGTGRSGGSWEAFGAREQQDYGIVLDWVLSQPWCNGVIGMYGASALGITSMLTAAQKHPGVKAVFPIVPMGDAYRDVVAVGGEGSFGFLAGWLTFVSVLAVLDPSFYQDPQQFFPVALQHAIDAGANFQIPTLARGMIGDPAIIDDCDFWALRSPVERMKDIDVPVFIVGGLHDVFQRGEPLDYEQLKNHTMTKLLMGPWDHFNAALGTGLPTGGVPALDTIALQWFDHYLKGAANGAENLPAVTQWVWGADRFVTTGDWPRPQAKAQRMYLHTAGLLATTAKLDSIKPTLAGGPRTTLMEPFNGLCSQSATQATLGILGLTQLPCYTNDGVANAAELVWQTAPLTQDLYIDGPIEADLFVSTSAMDAGLVVRVSDVDEGNHAFNLSNGMLLLSQRALDDTKSRKLDGQRIQPWHPFTSTTKQAPGAGKVVSASVEVWPTSALIRTGHRLRVSVGPSNFPAGMPAVPDLLAQLAGTLNVYGDAQHPSSMVIPVVPANLAH